MLLETLQPIVGSARNKQPFVIEALRQLAEKLGPGAKLPTAREMALALDITGATLTRCLQQLEDKGILRCRQGSGIYVAAGILQKRVAMVFGENIFSAASSPFGSMMVKHCSTRAAEHNMRFSFFLDTPAFNGVMDGKRVPVHQDLVDDLKRGEFDGIVLVARSSVEQEEWLSAQGVPMVSTLARLGAFVPGMQTVFLDYQKLVRLGVENLRKAGCKTVGLLGVSPEHRKMFQTAIKNLKLETKEDWIFCRETTDSFPAEFHQVYGREAAEKFLASNGGFKGRVTKTKLPDGLLVTDDMMARGVLPVLTAAGLELGRDLRVCSQSNQGSNVLAEWGSAISLVQFNLDDVATALFDMLEALMSGQPFASPHFVAPVSA